MIRACVVVVCMVALAGCWRSKPPPTTSPVEPLRAVKARPPGPAGEIYALDEALDDAFSGPWTFVGTGEWFGMFRVNACVYRNDRVFIVNIYCTLKEIRAFGLVVLSPTRGRVYVYVEGDKVPSASKVADWITFKGEATLVTDEPLRLDFTYAELRAWDERRYYKHSPGCFGGIEIKRPQRGCYRIPERTDEWAARNQAFLRDANPAWFRIIKDMRALTLKNARPYRDP